MANRLEFGIGDFDGDGDGDFAMANRDSNDVSVVINQTCEPSIPGDLDGDECVGQADLGILLSNWGEIFVHKRASPRGKGFPRTWVQEGTLGPAALQFDYA